MNIKIAKKDLAALLSRVAGAADKKSPLAALGSVLLRAEGSELAAYATDLFVAMHGRASAEVSEPGALAVSARDIVDRVKSMPDGPVQLVANEKSLTLKAPGTARKFVLRIMRADDFPSMPVADVTAPFATVPASTIASHIQRSFYAMGTDPARAFLNASLFDWGKGGLHVVATDGHKLALTVSESSASLDLMLVPMRAVAELRDLVAAAGDEPVRITNGGTVAFFEVAGTTLSAKLCDGTFPPYSNYIPSNPHHARVARAALVDAVKAVSGASDEFRGVQLAFSDGRLRVMAQSAERGEGFDEMPVDYPGGKICIGIAAHYLLDTLAACGGDEVQFELGGELDPIVVLPQEGPSLFIIMPMREKA